MTSYPAWGCPTVLRTGCTALMRPGIAGLWSSSTSFPALERHGTVQVARQFSAVLLSEPGLPALQRRKVKIMTLGCYIDNCLAGRLKLYWRCHRLIQYSIRFKRLNRLHTLLQV